MTAGYVPSAALNSLYSNTTPGTVADPAVIDSAVQTIVQTVNDNYDFATGLISAGTLSKLGIVNVKDYKASGSAQTTTGSITTGTNALTVASAIDFAVGQGINVAGAGAAGAVLITTINGINGTTLTLAVNASTTVTSVTVKHDDYAALNTLFNTTLSGIESTVYIPTGTYYITTNLTIPSNIKLVFFKNAMLSPATGIVMTINGPIDAGMYQIFTGSGTIAGSMKVDAVHPEWWGSTDTQKVQQATDYAITNGKSIRFSRMYDLTGGTITINKPNSNREILYLLGAGGGIKKDDIGSVFTATSADMGDIVSSNMKYKSISGGNTVVWDCDKLIRIVSSKDSYVNVDTVVRANTRFTQTVKFSKCTITGGSGWAFEWAKSYDTLIDGCTIEHRQNGIRNTVITGNPDNNTLRIANNVIEGLTGKAIELGSSFGVTIEGNYMELNTGGYIDLSTSLNYHNGLSIIGNTIQLSSSEITANVPAIKLGKLGNNGVLSSGNTSTGVLYETTSAGTLGLLASVGDISYNDSKVIGNTTILSEMGKVSSPTNGISYGMATIYNFTSAVTAFLAGEIKEITISTPNIGMAFNTKDLISVFIDSVSGNYEVIIHHYRPTANAVIVRVENKSTGNQNIGIGVRIHQIKQVV